MSLYNNNIYNFLEQLIFFNNLLTRNLYLNEINSLFDTNSNILFPPIFSQGPTSISNDVVLCDDSNKESGNESVSSLESSNLFSNSKNNYDLVKEEQNCAIGKRYKHRRPRKENKDNIRRKIKRGFFNCALLKKLNDKLRTIGSKKYFERFPQYFVSDVNQIRNKQILNMTLQEIFEKKELYIHKNGECSPNYFHNLQVVQNEEIKENKEFKKIMKKTFCQLYEEYINSNEFNDEINRLKKNNEDEYIAKYIYLAKNLIEFFLK